MLHEKQDGNRSTRVLLFVTVTTCNRTRPRVKSRLYDHTRSHCSLIGSAGTNHSNRNASNNRKDGEHVKVKRRKHDRFRSCRYAGDLWIIKKARRPTFAERKGLKYNPTLCNNTQYIAQTESARLSSTTGFRSKTCPDPCG